MTFKLDTSGVVRGPFNVTGYLTFDDLDPFTQGYAEALLTGLMGIDPADHLPREAGFSDLAPETLARIVEDCARFMVPERGVYGDNHALSGRAFWAMRQAQMWPPGFPPLTVSLGDDGKVYLREAGQ